jgi:hypothetical protein
LSTGALHGAITAFWPSIGQLPFSKCVLQNGLVLPSIVSWHDRI